MTTNRQASQGQSPLSGYRLLNDPLLNKGTAFTTAERDRFKLHGLLPPNVTTLDEQVMRRLQAFHEQPDDLARYVFLRGLQDTNETLFYALLSRHLRDMLPIVYTPTVGDGCRQFSRIFRKPRGLFLSPPLADRMDDILSNSHFDDVAVIVVTDGERILGLGDQGAGGMGIPIGKLSLYTACAGIHPRTTLPIMLDLGTDNQDLLADPLYIGWRHERVRGQAYDDFIDAFVGAVMRRWPNVLLQWEDFARANAGRILDRYRDRLCTFNDDIQGTAAVATGTLLSALAAAGTSITDQRIGLFGAGSAGCGIARLILRAMIDAGQSEEEARSRFFAIDRDGLLVEGMKVEPFQASFVQSRAAIEGWQRDHPDKIGLLDVARNAKLTTLIGVSGQTGAFTEEVVKAMAANIERPIILPLSNPTSRSEATPVDLLTWTEGRAVVGTGSPFPPVTYGDRTIAIDQTNNSYIFPGVGLGVIAARSRRVTDTMFMAAAKALAAASPAAADRQASLLPPVTELRGVAARIAVAVAEQAGKEGLAGSPAPFTEEAVAATMWEPRYRADGPLPSA